jgi:hypothetical protein
MPSTKVNSNQVELEFAQTKWDTINHFNREHATTTGVALAYRSGFKNIRRVLLDDISAEGARLVVTCDNAECPEYFEVLFQTTTRISIVT